MRLCDKAATSAPSFNEVKGTTMKDLKKQRDQANSLLDSLIALDAEVHGAYYEMGQILSAIEHGGLWDVLEYDSLTHLVEEELSISPSQARRYMNTFRHFKRLGYNKSEALDLMSEFSFTNMSNYLPTAKDKVGKRAIKNAIARMIEEHKQINFQLAGDDLRLLVEVLQSFGAEYTDTGRLMNSSDALMSLARSSLPVKNPTRHLRAVT